VFGEGGRSRRLFLWHVLGVDPLYVTDQLEGITVRVIRLSFRRPLAPIDPHHPRRRGASVLLM
jgi:hypothetical protein